MIALGKDGRGEDRFTSRDMIEVEARLERATQAIAALERHRVADRDRNRALASAESRGPSMSGEQRAAFDHAIDGKDLGVIIGYAGTGKSAMLGVAREAWAEAGFQVCGAALSGIATEGLEAGSAIPLRTIASLEHQWGQGRALLTSRDVLVIDEAGMIGSCEIERVLSAAENAGAKVVLVGDPQQLQAIEAGAAFRSIAERQGVVAITEIRRQQVDWQRDAKRHLAIERTAEALQAYNEHDMVHVADTREAARAQLVEGWERAHRAFPDQSQIILTHTNDEVRSLNDLARSKLREAGVLGDDVTINAERGARQFSTGDRIMFLRNDRELGVKNGSLGKIERISPHHIAAKLDDGRSVSIVSQGVGIAIGVQEKFSFKGVALAALSAGISGGIGAIKPFQGGGFLASAARAAGSSALTQGIAVVARLQNRFSFVGVAAAGVAAGVGHLAGDALGKGGLFGIKLGANTVGNFAASSAARAIANAATRGAINGENFGQNLIAAIPDVIAGILQKAIGTAVDEAKTPSVAARAEKLSSALKIVEQRPESATLKDAQKLQIASVIAQGDINDAKQVAASFGVVLNDTAAGRVDAGIQLLASRGAPTTAIERATSVVRDPEFLGVIDQTYSRAGDGSEIVVTGIGAKLLEATAGKAGHLIADYGNNEYVEAGLFLIGAAAAPISTLVLTTIDNLPVVGSVKRDFEEFVGRKIFDAGVSVARSAGVSAAEQPFVVAGVVGLVGLGFVGKLAVNFAKSALGRLKGASGKNSAVEGAPGLANEIGILRDAARGKGNFGLGSATAQDAARLGEAWVGKGYAVSTNGKVWTSADGLRQFRPSSYKPKLGITQSNFEQRLQSAGRWQSNGHLDIVP